MSDYEEYLERYAKSREIPKEVAETHVTVRLVKEFYEKGEKGCAKSVEDRK